MTEDFRGPMRGRVLPKIEEMDDEIAAAKSAWDDLIASDDADGALHIWRKDDWMAGYIQGRRDWKE